MKITAGGSSRKGPHRKQNEDAFRIYQDQPMVQRAGRGTIYAVADGVGGTGTGRYAAWHVVDSLAHFFTLPASRFEGGRTLKQIIARCDQTLQQLGRETPEYQLSGTTLAMLYVSPNPRKGYMLSIGDSGVFVHHQGEWSQLNEDHRNERGKVTSTIGLGQGLRVSWRSLRIRPGDVFLLCTDGVRDMLPVDMIAEQSAAWAHPQMVADRITLMAEEAGGLDNATALVVRFGDCPPG